MRANSDLRGTFNRILVDIVRGELRSCPSDTGLDSMTIDALDLLAGLSTPKLTSDIGTCRTEFEHMLDGTHARQQAESDDADWHYYLGRPPI